MAGPEKQRTKFNQGPKRGDFSLGIAIANTADHLATIVGSAAGLAYDTATKGGKRADKLLAKRVARSAKRGKKRRGSGPDQF
jgi:hypothetical protein